MTKRQKEIQRGQIWAKRAEAQRRAEGAEQDRIKARTSKEFSEATLRLVHAQRDEQIWKQILV